MISVRFRLSCGPLIALIAAGLLAACGSGGAHKSTAMRSAQKSPAVTGQAAPRPPAAGSGTHTIPAPAPTGIPASATAVSVIRAWSDALRRGDVLTAARYFALPSSFINGPAPNGRATVTAIRTLGLAEAVNAALPCGARLISADQRGRYVNALFRLTNRPGLGGGCGAGTGQTARTNFVIVNGHIVEWIRAPDDPGDNSTPSQPGPAQPATPQPAGPSV